jgi:hypothetical protein
LFSPAAGTLAFSTNGAERMRMNNNGEVVVGAATTAIAGDLLCAQGTAVNPWAVNGYTNLNAGGVYGQVQSGATNFAGVQGEYNGTSNQGAGVRGIYMTTTSGTSYGSGSIFPTVVSGVNGDASTVGSYKFGVYGAGGISQRSGGVFGADMGFAKGCLGYLAAGFTDHAVYGFGFAYTTGVATGRYALNTNEVDFNNWSVQEPNSTIGLGIYGGVMGGWIKGLVYGVNLSGVRYGAYVHGKTITNNVIATLHDNPNSDTRVATYATTSMQVDITDRGRSRLMNGRTLVKLKEEFLRITSDKEPFTITVTPIGLSNGLYIEETGKRGEFWVIENNNGTSNVEFNYIVIGVKKDFEKPLISPEILADDFEEKMNGNKGVMYNDQNPADPDYSIWFDGNNVRFDKRHIERKAPENPAVRHKPTKN